MNNHYFDCDCASLEHTFCVTSEDHEEDFPPQLYFHLQLNQYRNFFKRVWTAIKYLFGYECKYGHWDTVNISEDDVHRLIVLLHQHRVKTEKFKIFMETYNERAN